MATDLISPVYINYYYSTNSINALPPRSSYCKLGEFYALNQGAEWAF